MRDREGESRGKAIEERESIGGTYGMRLVPVFHLAQA